jgi:xanthine dehydrogenase accessory factor
MSEYMETLKRWAGEGVAWAEAILVKAQHSSPLPPGARLAVNTRGERVGAISMGCVETDLQEPLQTGVKEGTSRLLHYGASTSMIFEVGLSCGGEIDVLLRRRIRTPYGALSSDRDPSQSALLLTAFRPPCAGGNFYCLKPARVSDRLETPNWTGSRVKRQNPFGRAAALSA